MRHRQENSKIQSFKDSKRATGITVAAHLVRFFLPFVGKNSPPVDKVLGKWREDATFAAKTVVNG
jgi:hypothetical protein